MLNGKVLYSLFMLRTNKLECLPRQIFTTWSNIFWQRPGAYLTQEEFYPQVGTNLPRNIRLGRKSLPGKKIIVYLVSSRVTKKKSFMILTLLITEFQPGPHSHLLQLLGAQRRRQDRRRARQVGCQGLQERDHPRPGGQGQHIHLGLGERRPVQGQLQLRRVRHLHLHHHHQQHLRVGPDPLVLRGLLLDPGYYLQVLPSAY